MDLDDDGDLDLIIMGRSEAVTLQHWMQPRWHKNSSVVYLKNSGGYFSEWVLKYFLSMATLIANSWSCNIFTLIASCPTHRT